VSALMDKLFPERLDDADSGFGALRRRAQKVLMQHGFPHRKTENWKYVPLGLLEKRDFGAPGGGDAGRAEAPSVPFDAGVVHVQDGRLDPQRCDLPGGVSLRPTAAGEVDLELLRDDGPADAFAWLNLARCDEAWTLRVEGRADRPLLLAATCSDAFDHAAHPRLRLELAPGAELTLIEYQHGGGAGLLNAVLDIALDADASLTHVLARGCDETAWIQRSCARIGERAAYRAFALDGGGSLTRQDLVARLESPGASAVVAGVGVLSGRSLVDYHTAIEHVVGGTESEENFRMLADDRAVGVFNGRILIVPGADDSHSQMNTGNMLLSDAARINTKPELEIHAEDVTASHGATVGQLDDVARFYLRSRGLDDAQAMALLKFGFAAAVFDQLPPGAIRDWLTQLLEDHL
jgi:Fe-S cluster assembly protein SufD